VLVLRTSRPSLEIGDLDGSAGRVPEAVDGQCLATLDLEPGLQCEQDEERDDVVAGEVTATVQLLGKMLVLPTAAPARRKGA
jgi:hypothetical protein